MARGRIEIEDVLGKRYWREAEARKVVEAWRRGGRTLAGFAREHGVEAARVARWVARLRAGEGARAVRFHPVRVVGSTLPVARPALEVVLGNGCSVRVPTGFAADDLRKVLEVLDELARC